MIRASVIPEENENHRSYSVSFGDGHGFIVVIQRSLQEFFILRDNLLATNYLPPEITATITAEPAPDVIEIESFLNYWLPFYHESPQISEILIRFIEDCPGQTEVTQLQFNVLKQKIAEITEQNRRYALKLQDMTERNAQLSDMVNHLQNRGSSSSSVDEDFPVRTSSHSDASALIPSAQMTPIGSEGNIGFDFSHTPRTNEDTSVLAMPVPLIVLPESLGPSDAINGDDESPRNKTALNMSDLRATAEALYRNCPDHDQVHRFDEAVADILQGIKPHPSQIAYRNSVAALLKRQIRQILHVNAFECGLHEIRCFLPDEPTKLTVILGKNRVAQWHKTLHDRLTLLAEQPELSKAARVRSMDEDFAADQDDEYPMFDHVVGKVHVSSEDATFKVDCVVDTTEASISCNRRGDVCLLVFLEEMSKIVGTDDLFKRSLLLIRAWWFYETAVCIGSSIRHYLSDSSICVMVCAIFNQYHARISSPLQALCLFLAEYSAYDGATHAITLQGIVPFKSDSTSQLVVVEPKDHHLITSAVLEKYWVLFNIQEASSSPMYFNQAVFTDDLNGDIASGAFLTRGHQQGYASSYCGGAGNAAQRAYQQSTTRFERSGFNVVHPFANANLMEKLMTRRLQRVQKAFSVGAANFLTLINRGRADDSPGSISHNMKAFFAVVTSRFGKGFVRPDCIPDGPGSPRQNAAMYGENLLVVQVERLMSNILYSNFVLESVLSDSALLMLCTEILKEKKIQPVGEVGKMLAEITSSPNLSGKLKEKFGGLKKFLEFYAQRFIFANDHQFNPSVTLRSILDSVNLDANEGGALAFNNMHKARRNGSKRTTPLASPDVSYGIIRDSGAPYGITPPGTSRSMNTYTTGSPHSGSLGMGTMGLTGREGYSYGSMSVDARRKVNAYGNTVGVEPPWRTDFDPARPRGISGSAGPIAEYSPRQGIQRAMGAGRAYPSTVPPPPPQQAHDQTHLQYGVAPRTMNRSQAYAMAQQQQQQQLPPPQGYSPHAYPRQFNNRPPQPLPAPVPLQHQQHQQYDARQYGGAGGAGGSYPPPRSTSSMPLYARQSGGNNNYTSSPQLQSHEMDVSRFPLGGSDSSVGAGPNTYSQQQGLYQQRSSLPDRSGGGGGVGGSLGVGGDMHGFNDIMRDIDASLRLSEYTLPAADNGGGGVNGLTNTSFSTTISRPESDRAGANANPASSTQDDQKWY